MCSLPVFELKTLTICVHVVSRGTWYQIWNCRLSSKPTFSLVLRSVFIGAFIKEALHLKKYRVQLMYDLDLGCSLLKKVRDIEKKVCVCVCVCVWTFTGLVYTKTIIYLSVGELLLNIH